MKDFQVAADDHAGAVQFAQHAGHHVVVARELIVQPDVAHGETDLFEQMENQFQFGVGEGFARDAPIEHGHAEQGFAIKDRHGDLTAEQFKFLLRLRVGADFVAVAAQDATEAEELSAKARVEGQFKMFQQAGRETRGCRPARNRRPSSSGLRRRSGKRTQKNGRAIQAHDLAELQQKLAQHRFGIERVRQEGGKIAQNRQGLRGGHDAGRRRLRRAVGCFCPRESSGWADLRRYKNPLQQGREGPRSNRLGQNMRDPPQISLFLPLGLFSPSVNDDWTARVPPAQPFYNPHVLHAVELDIKDDALDEPVRQHGFGFRFAGPMNDPVLGRIQTRANRVGDFGVWRENENGLHRAVTSSDSDLQLDGGETSREEIGSGQKATTRLPGT